LGKLYESATEVGKKGWADAVIIRRCTGEDPGDELFLCAFFMATGFSSVSL
jgi:hypothetical protein